MSISFDVSQFAKKIKPRRTILYAPSMEIKKVEKATLLSKLDTVALDLEDGVPQSMKETARNSIISFLSTKKRILPELAIRINSLQTKDSMLDLNNVLMNENVSKKCKTLIMSKVEDPDEVKFVSRWLNLNNSSHIKILAMIETPLGITNIDKICKSSEMLDGLIFGAEDFRTSSGIGRDLGDIPIQFARSKIVSSSKSYNLQAIDMISLDFKNEENVIKDSKNSKTFGFTGKQVIHPMQIECVNKAFLPNENELQNAINLMKIFIKAQNNGKGVFGSNGQMVELPHIKDAIQTLIF